jgi:thioredoxin reductase
MTALSDVVIIGAGPYGLSIGAHLRARGVDFRIFGKPMHSWRTQMPAGMLLKSEAFASSLYDPDGAWTLKKFCVERGVAYRDYGSAVPVETFVDYGLSFQERLVPEVEDRTVVGFDRANADFQIRLDGGETVAARRVVVAIGSAHFRYVPSSLAHLPPELLSHSCDHHDLGRFKGRDVCVIGGGASALDLVASLQRAGAEVRLIARCHALKWNTPACRPVWKAWYPMSGLGGGWRNRLYENAPMLFRRLPQDARIQIIRSWLGPSGAWPIKDCVERAPLMLGHMPRSADVCDGRVRLKLVNANGDPCEVTTEHVISATGYRVNLRNLPFLSEQIRARLRLVDGAPNLSPDFQSSIHGLHFVGLASANSFGPVMRFVLGARFTARRLSRHFARASAS